MAIIAAKHRSPTSNPTQPTSTHFPLTQLGLGQLEQFERVGVVNHALLNFVKQKLHFASLKLFCNGEQVNGVEVLKSLPQLWPASWQGPATSQTFKTHFIALAYQVRSMK